jgi:hypothetical protein
MMMPQTLRDPPAPTPFRVLVTGSRHARGADHERRIRLAILEATGHLKVSEMGRVVLVHGDAPGVDAIAVAIVRSLPWPIQIESHPARAFGAWPECGPRRNSHMVSLGADICLAFPQPGSKGTWDCARKAADAGIPVVLQTLPVEAP